MPKKSPIKRRSKKKELTSFDSAMLAAKAAENKKAEDISIIDVKDVSSVCDYIVICSAQSPPQIKAITREIDDVLKKNKIKISRWQGDAKSNWMVLDLFDVVIHVTDKTERSKYDIEGIWEKSGVIYHI